MYLIQRSASGGCYSVDALQFARYIAPRGHGEDATKTFPAGWPPLAGSVARGLPILRALCEGENTELITDEELGRP